jgi:AAA domain
MGNNDRFTFQRPSWMASYQTPMHPSYADNPLILALPRAYTPEQVLHCLRLQPPYEDEWRLRPAMERMEILLNAADFFQPLTQHLDLEQRFSRMLRRGYVGRNPLDHGYWAHTRQQCKALSEFVPGTTRQAACVQGFTLLGISGIGKSRALERILSLYPQVVLHEAFAEKRFTWVQLVWLKLDCPQDGSLKGLCQSFFEEVDAILGTNYYATYAVHGKASTDQMLVFMARVARLHSIGTIVIDELQNLRQANGNMAERVLNFFDSPFKCVAGQESDFIILKTTWRQVLVRQETDFPTDLAIKDGKQHWSECLLKRATLFSFTIPVNRHTVSRI